MIVLDTHVMIWRVLSPKDITAKARKVIQQAQKNQSILASEISFWEIAMLIKKQRLKIDADALTFINLLRTMHVITSRFVAQLHRVFGCSSIVESST